MACPQLDNEFSRRFFAPLIDVYPDSLRQYDCTEISDVHYAQLGVLRTLSSSLSGQEFLQHHAEQNVAEIDPGHFFKALKSGRRLANITSLNDLLAGPMTADVPDPYAQCRELDGWDLYAVDGHYHKAACFDPKTSGSKESPSAIATGHFFRANLRTHHLSCLDMVAPEDGKKKVHDMRVIKRSTAESLRYGGPKGRKVMLVWDKACIDYRLWYKLKHIHGIYFLTMEKSNSTAEICSPDMLDRTLVRFGSKHVATSPLALDTDAAGSAIDDHAMLIDSGNVGEVLARLDTEDFFRRAHQLIFDCIVTLFERENEVDSLILADELDRRGQMHEVGGYDFLNTLTQGIPRIANIEYYANMVKQKSLLRRLASIGNEISSSAYAADDDAACVINAAEQAVVDLREGDRRHDFLEVKEVLDESYGLIQERGNQEGDLIGLPTGFVDFDKRTSGLQKDDLLIVAARPAMGKTAFCLNLAVSASLKGNAKVAIFSLEMSAAQLSMRLMGSTARVSISKLRNGRLEPEEWAKVADAVAELSRAEIFIDDTGDLNVFQIRAKLKRLQRERGLDLVIIDYMQLMSSASSSAQNRTQEVSEISRGLKVLAKELNVPLIALSQLSRAAEHRSEHRPQLADLRESGSIEQDADLVCFLYREDYYKKQKGEQIEPLPTEDYQIAELIIAKHRNGPTGTLKLAFFKEFTRFESYGDVDMPMG